MLFFVSAVKLTLICEQVFRVPACYNGHSIAWQQIAVDNNLRSSEPGSYSTTDPAGAIVRPDRIFCAVLLGLLDAKTFAGAPPNIVLILTDD